MGSLNFLREFSLHISIVPISQKGIMSSKQHNQSQTCPFIDDGYVSYNTCNVYHRLSGIQRNPSLDMTINGQAVELRPTGS